MEVLRDMHHQEKIPVRAASLCLTTHPREKKEKEKEFNTK
jgi:hypothetical protein